MKPHTTVATVKRTLMTALEWTTTPDAYGPASTVAGVMNPLMNAADDAADVLLTTGAVVTIRPVVAADEASLTSLYGRTKPDALRLRFFTYSVAACQQEVSRLIRPASNKHMAVVAVDRGRILGVGCVERTSKKGTAEFALLVDDQHHAEGIGTLLLEHLVAAARTMGYTHLSAEVLAENSGMLRVLHSLGARLKEGLSYGVVDAEFSLKEQLPWQRAVGEREGTAEHASIVRLLAPRTVAVVGAGSNAEGVGHRILASLVDGGFTGELYAVNRTGAAVCGVPAARSVRDLPCSPDLVVIAVPATSVLDVVDDCAVAGAYGVVVVSDGFAELGGTGRDQQSALVSATRRAGMRLVGPNCLGVVNADSAVRLNATFADLHPIAGPVGLASQSGGVGLALLNYLTDRRIGVSTFVSMGNKADVSSNDLLMYWERDPATKVCVLYLESFGNARKFARVARRVARTKPIVAVTAGRSVAGARGVKSHTAAAATPDVAIDALFQQAGVIRAQTLSEALDIVGLLTDAPLPSSRRVAVLTNGGGPGALAADACAAAGLVLPNLSRGLQQRLIPVLPQHAATSNPVDTTAGGGPAALAAATRVLLASDEIDSVIVVHTSLEATDTDTVATALAEIASAPLQKPLIGVFLGRPDVPRPLQRPDAGAIIPCFAFPEIAAGSLAAVARYSEWRDRPHRPTASPRGIRRRTAGTIVADFLREHPDGGWMDTDGAASLVESYGIPVVPTSRADSPEQAVVAAETLGFPVAVKAASGAVLHRTDIGAVKLSLRTPDEVLAAVTAIQETCGPRSPVVVQRMLPHGVETAVGIVNDPTVGPIVMLGLGGVATDLLADRSFRLPPLTRVDVHEQIRSLRASPLLFGYRGAPRSDVRGLEDVLLRVSQLASELPELAELDLNPVIVSPDGAIAVDVKVRLAPACGSDPYLRRLSVAH
jgi:acyl-CoA synthetase (NDP forming)/GNAT superfamily N-acetyltransferase